LLIAGKIRHQIAKSVTVTLGICRVASWPARRAHPG
jgi:hypothetical protein